MSSEVINQQLSCSSEGMRRFQGKLCFKEFDRSLSSVFQGQVLAARHERLKAPLVNLAYQPLVPFNLDSWIELFRFLRPNEFITGRRLQFPNVILFIPDLFRASFARTPVLESRDLRGISEQQL